MVDEESDCVDHILARLSGERNRHSWSLVSIHLAQSINSISDNNSVLLEGHDEISLWYRGKKGGISAAQIPCQHLRSWKGQDFISI
jgi:hypothetical protein